MTDKQTEALKLALETFQSMNHEDSIFAGEYDDEIAALREALAEQPAQQQEPEYKGWYCAHCQRGVDGSEVTYNEQHTVCGRVITDDLPPKPQQEPVAWWIPKHKAPDMVSKVRWSDECEPLYTSPPAQQDPVAWRNAALRIGEDLCSVGPFGYYDMTAEQWLDWALSVVTVHAPSAQRTWVHATAWRGLTDEELRQVWYDDAPVQGGTYIDKLRQVETKLKEKNSG